MLNIYSTRETGSIAIWPATGSATNANFRMILTNDMNMNSSSFSLSLTGSNPNNLSEYYTFNYFSGSSGLPSASGLYTYDLQDDLGSGQLTWTQAKQTYSTTQFKWSNYFTSSGVFQDIDTGRCYLFGTNDPEFTNYVTTNENGTYTTYYS